MIVAKALSHASRKMGEVQLISDQSVLVYVKQEEIGRNVEWDHDIRSVKFEVCLNTQVSLITSNNVKLQSHYVLSQHINDNMLEETGK